MQINVVMTKASMKKWLNIFLKENDLIFFHEDAARKVHMADHLSDDLFNTRDLIIYIGNKKVFEDNILPLTRRLTTEDKIDFIYGYTELFPGEVKITDTVFSWNTSKSEAAKKNGKQLKTFFDKQFGKGMKAVDERYASMNKTLAQFYWSDDAPEVENKLYNTGGVVRIAPLEK